MRAWRKLYIDPARLHKRREGSGNQLEITQSEELLIGSRLQNQILPLLAFITQGPEELRVNK